MQNGFVKVAVATPKIRVADTGYNAARIVEKIHEAAKGERRNSRAA